MLLLVFHYCICGSLCHCPSFNLAWVKFPFPFFPCSQSPTPFNACYEGQFQPIFLSFVAISAVLCPPCFKAMILVGNILYRGLQNSPTVHLFVMLLLFLYYLLQPIWRLKYERSILNTLSEMKICSFLPLSEAKRSIPVWPVSNVMLLPC